MGRAIDLFVTYRFIKLLVTPFEKQEAYKLGVIDKDGNKETEYHGDRTESGFVRFVKKLLCKAGSSADC